MVMSYQFAHLATYSGKGNAANRTSTEIALEAARAPGNAPHVNRPAPPNILFGIDPRQVPAEIDRRVTAAKIALKGSGRGSGIRADTHVLAASVYSHPTPAIALSEDVALRDTYEAWRTATVAMQSDEASTC